MANAELHTVISDLVSISQAKGYLSFDDILDMTDKLDLPLDDIDRISDRLLTAGIILRENNHHTISTDNEDDESNNRSKIDYDLMFNEIIEMYPSLKSFINEVRLIPPPQTKEVDSLIYQAIDGNKYAYDRIIKMYLKVVVRIAYLLSKQYYLPLEDTIQDGVIGLISAYESFDSTLGKHFTTQISWVIRNAILREAPTINPLVYFPIGVKEQIFSIYDIVFEHQCEYCSNKVICPKLVQNVSDKLEIDNETAYLFLQYLTNSESLDLILEKNECFFSDNGAAEEQMIEELYEAEINKQLLFAFAYLKEREREVLMYRYGFYNGQEKTLEEVGSIFGVTRERIRQIEVIAIKKLQRYQRIYNFLSI